KGNEAYLSIIIRSRGITGLGTISDVKHGVIERMFTADLGYLQELYRSVNEDATLGRVACPSCSTEFEVEPGELMAPVGA
ncbi:MAG: hypothetical protein IH861_06750, partial [Chloroflexi bacterium]|nr:hypothetical protein [Chloroflexota bacterium]